MNDIPRGTPSESLIRFLAALIHDLDSPGSQFGDTPPDASHGDVDSLRANMDYPVIEPSRLDDDTSVSVIRFKHTPKCFGDLGPHGFPQKTNLGRIWEGVDMTGKDGAGQTTFIREVINNNFELAETLAEYKYTDINAQDNKGRIALHWACEKSLPELVGLCLSVPGLNIGLKYDLNLTAFDIAGQKSYDSGDDRILALFYDSIFEIEKYDPDTALLRLLTLRAKPASAEQKPNFPEHLQLFTLSGDLGEENTEFPGEALFGPAERGNLALIEAILDRGISKNVVSDCLDTAQDRAKENGHLDIVKRISKARVDLVADEDLVWTLPLAAKRDRQDIVGRLLLDEGVDVDERDDDTRTALQWAAELGNLEIVVALLIAGANVGARDDDMRTALGRAAEGGHSEIVSMLLEARADKNGKDGTRTVLGWAAGAGHSGVVRILLNLEVNVNARDNEMRTALGRAVEGGHLKIVEMLLEAGADIYGRYRTQTALAEDGYSEVMGRSLEEGDNMNGRDGTRTLLGWAAGGGHLEVVRVLLRAEISVNERDNEMRTALGQAAEGGHLEVVRRLLEAGANIDGIDGRSSLEVETSIDERDEMRTALGWAAGGGHSEVVRMLLGVGADVNVGGEGILTALDWAVRGGHSEVVRILLGAGADVNARDGDTRTALEWAVGGRHLEIVKILLEAGANVNERNVLGLARRREYLQIEELLLNAGADIERRGE